ncbi:MAG: hypothetical protein ACTSWC_04030 [Promethearchaeota archaeon]
MNFCIHGYPIENCPHCLKTIGIKPPIQLVKPAPREIPMPISHKEKLLNSNKITPTPLFKGSTSIMREIKPIPRQFHLESTQIHENESLFLQRKKLLEEKYKIGSESENLFQPEQLIDLKKKFTLN